MLLTNRINAINAQVTAYQEQIAELQAKITTLQSHAQEVQGVEQAAESALSQIEAAINMLQVVCPEEIATFKAAIDSKFNVLPTIAPAAQRQDSVTTPTPTPPNEPETVEAIATTLVEEPQDDTSSVEPETPLETETTDATKIAQDDNTGNGDNDNGNGNGHNGHLLTYKDLDKVDRATLVKLADKHGIAYTTKTKKYELATALGGMVTQVELDAAKNEK